MRSLVAFGAGFSICATALAACSTNSSQFAGTPAGAPGAQSLARSAIVQNPRSGAIPRALWPQPHAYVMHARPDSQKGYIFNSQANYSTVDYYQKGRGNVPVAGSLAGSFSFPQGVYADKAGNVYVANTGDSNVLVFAPGAVAQPTQTLTDPGEQPIDTVVARDGKVYVANIVDVAGGPGSVSVYARGETSPTSRLTDPNFTQVIGVALDKDDDLFVSYANSSNVGSVAEYPAHSTVAQETGIAIGFPGGVDFDKAGHLLLTDQFSGVLDVFDVGTSTPVNQLALPGDACFFTFASPNRLYTADFQNESIDVFDYTPTALTLTDQITSGMNQYGNSLGVATTKQTSP